ncbi:MAG: hypothetical protein IJI54_14165 [Kiritimatiellae bacterium]|nr:hypothetical protein [Kiritimatiellia bacterium]
MAGAMHRARPWEKLAAKADAGTRVRAMLAELAESELDTKKTGQMKGK